ncbi:hypothetical protein RHGRI_034036 [Rhododendron griersonianum]|uniref:Zinc finger PHD-type domain-containing protein n=1 Tax=Rhododendron griersonianum TaxID=479676 RepID=A0AAV6I219_9ERIC|nr:hypothetical protein RHGRI_034036 [Rhododendron griersonianum]
MLSCKSCGKKYHRSCLKAWAQRRDLFHWSSWTCPSCRICEVCRRTGDQTRFMFCKRCDGAYHCYCQQPPHKNVSNGPYLCSKHTRCPGNGLSVRFTEILNQHLWFAVMFASAGCTVIAMGSGFFCSCSSILH